MGVLTIRALAFLGLYLGPVMPNFLGNFHMYLDTKGFIYPCCHYCKTFHERGQYPNNTESSQKPALPLRVGLALWQQA